MLPSRTRDNCSAMEFSPFPVLQAFKIVGWPGFHFVCFFIYAAMLRRNSGPAPPCDEQTYTSLANRNPENCHRAVAGKKLR